MIWPGLCCSPTNPPTSTEYCWLWELVLPYTGPLANEPMRSAQERRSIRSALLNAPRVAERPPRRRGAQHRRGEVEPRDLAAAAQVEPLGVDAGHLPSRGLAPEKMPGIELDRLGVIAVHVADDLRLGDGEGARIAAEVQFGGLDPRDPAEAGDQMAAFDHNAIKVEIGKSRIGRASGMASRETRRSPRIVATLGPPQQGQPRAGQRVGLPGDILEQQ